MKAKRFTEEQIISILQQAEAGAKRRPAWCAQKGVLLRYVAPGKPMQNG